MAEKNLYFIKIFFCISLEVIKLKAINAAFLCSSSMYLLIAKLNPPKADPEIPSFFPGRGTKSYSIYGTYQYF